MGTGPTPKTIRKAERDLALALRRAGRSAAALSSVYESVLSEGSRTAPLDTRVTDLRSLALTLGQTASRFHRLQ
jgi:hypothetical protein